MSFFEAVGKGHLLLVECKGDRREDSRRFLS